MSIVQLRSCVLAALVALAACSTKPSSPDPLAGDEYVEEAKSQVLLGVPPGSRPQFLKAERYNVARMIAVCGQIRLSSGETVPFLVNWRRHERLDEALVMLPRLERETPMSGALIQQAEAIEQTCEGLRQQNGQVAPPSLSPPDISPEQYVAAARAKVLERIASIPDSEVVSAEYAQTNSGDVVVCGTVRTGAEHLPFSSIWDAADPLDEGGFMVAIVGETTPARDSKLEVFSRTVRDHCRGVGLAHVVR